MEEINILSESIIKIESVKEEPVDVNDDDCWNDYEELEPPMAVFIKQETSCTDDEKEPLSSCCGSASIDAIKHEFASCSSDGGRFVAEKTSTFGTQQSRRTDVDCIYKSSFSNNDLTIQLEHPDPNMRIHSEKRFKCSVCVQTLSTKEKFYKHVRSHTGERSFHCCICERSFSQKAHLDSHLRTHTGEKPFKCSNCEKTFAQKGTLDRHMRTHTGEKPFQCSICGKMFTTKAHMAHHLLTHTSEKPSHCSICEKIFSRKDKLVRHMRTHSEKQFHCFTCGRTFTRKRTLRMHILNHSGEKRFPYSH